MTSFDYRLNPLYLIKECSSCGALDTTDYCCSVGILEDKIICDLDKTPDLSQRSPQNRPKCGNPVYGHYCQGCALLRKKFKEDLFSSCVENGILQDSFGPSNDNSNVANALREPFVVNLDPVVWERFHYGYNCPPKVPIIPDPEPFNNQTIKELPPTVQSSDPKSDLVHNSPNVFSPSLQPPIYSYEFCGNDAYYGQDCSLQQYLDEMKRLINSEYRDEIKIDELKGNFNSMSIKINKKEKLQQLEQVANLCTYPSKRFNSFFYNDDDDADYSFSITPNEPDNSLSMGDEHLNTILATESDEFIKSSVENLVPIPSESEGKSECDVPVREEFTTFSNILFDAEYEFDSSDDQSSSDEDVPEKIFSNPLFDEDITPMKIDQLHYNAESDLIESLRTHDSSIIISSKIDSLLDYDSLMKEISLTFTLDYPMLPSIEDDNYDSKRDILILKDLLSNDTLSLSEKESFHFDIPSFSRPPAKPPDSNTGILNVKMMGDISEQKVHIPKLMITLVPNQEKYPDHLSHMGHDAFQLSANCPNTPILDVPLFHFYPLNQLKYGGLGQAQ
nr:hypothetical protein [Tanacetum cinerariifolium]